MIRRLGLPKQLLLLCCSLIFCSAGSSQITYLQDTIGFNQYSATIYLDTPLRLGSPSFTDVPTLIANSVCQVVIPQNSKNVSFLEFLISVLKFSELPTNAELTDLDLSAVIIVKKGETKIAEITYGLMFSHPRVNNNQVGDDPVFLEFLLDHLPYYVTERWLRGMGRGKVRN